VSAVHRVRLVTFAVLAGVMVATNLQAQDRLVFENVNLIDGSGRPMQPGMTVVVEGERIAAIAPTRNYDPGAGQRIDGSGRYLMPGLMDMHIHLRGGVTVTPEGLREAGADRAQGESALASFLYSGVTSVYDAGNNPDFIYALRSDERAGRIASPRLFVTGGIVTYPGSHGAGPGYTAIDSWPEAKPLLDAHMAREPDLIKFTLEERGWGARPMIPYLPQGLLQHAIEYYNDRGFRTTIHTSNEFRARQALFVGIDTLSHPVIQGPISEEFARLMAAKKTPMVTTLTIGDSYSRLVDDPDHLQQPLYRASLASAESQEILSETLPAWRESTWTWWMKLMTPVAQENLRKIHAAGGVLVLGTDQSLGAATHRELELLAAAGIPLADLTRIATLNGAIFLGREADLGSVEVGKLADLLLLEADPLQHVDNYKAIVAVIKGGTVVDAERLPLAGSRTPRSPLR